MSTSTKNDQHGSVPDAPNIRLFAMPDGGLVSVKLSRWLHDERLRPDCQIFAVGDVHGHPDELNAMLEGLASEATPASHLVLLGDIIDKGPDPLRAISTSSTWLKSDRFTKTTGLIGNHDLFYYSSTLHNHQALDFWRQAGGKKMLKQLEVGVDIAKIRPKLIEAIGLEAVETYEAAVSHIELGNILLVHGGISPDMTISEMFSRPKWDDYWLRDGKPRHHWAWIRAGFLDYEGPFEGGRIVIHGHTAEAWTMKRKRRAFPDPLHQIDGSRLGLDGTRGPAPTLTGAEIWNGRYRIYTVGLPGEVVLGDADRWVD
jgi:serine/threonine protein phosphatase 1